MILRKNKVFSDREKVPESIAKKAKKSGVVQKYKGSWRIVSFKTNPPEFWDAHYNSKSSAESGLRGYQSSK